MYWKYWWSKNCWNCFFEHGNDCVCSYTIFVVLAVIALAISIWIGAYFAYKYMNHNQENISKYSYYYQANY